MKLVLLSILLLVTTQASADAFLYECKGQGAALTIFEDAPNVDVRIKGQALGTSFSYVPCDNGCDRPYRKQKGMEYWSTHDIYTDAVTGIRVEKASDDVYAPSYFTSVKLTVGQKTFELECLNPKY